MNLVGKRTDLRCVAIDVFTMAPVFPGPLLGLQGSNVAIQNAHSELECCKLLYLHGRHATGACADATVGCDVILHVI